MPNKYSSVSNKLVSWYRAHARDLPWRHTEDPYLIWISEIILQQTTVAQGLDYYNRFVLHFPDVVTLANSDLDLILKVWQGLGYYSRARNLHKAAIKIVDEYKGVFPSTHDEIIKLPGIGAYTAAAISSFAFDERKPVVDGNVIRFITRLFGIDLLVEKSSTKKLIYSHAVKLIRHQSPKEWNQVIMEHGAITCTYKNPQCSSCVIKKSCQAFKQKTVDTIPVKKKKKPKTSRFFNYIVLIDNKGNTLINKRIEGDVWAGLYEFPLIEKQEQLDSLSTLEVFDINKKDCEIYPSKIFKQTLSHQVIHAKYFLVKYKKALIKKNIGLFQCVKYKNLDQYPIPRIVDLYLSDLSITLF